MKSKKKVRVAIAGVEGRMSKLLIQTALKMNYIALSAILVHKDSKLVGSDVGDLIGAENLGIIIQNNFTSIKDEFDVFIDFTHPERTLKNLEYCRKYNKPMVIGTTGFNKSSKQIIKIASQKIAIVFAANFSFALNVMLKLLETTAKIMGDCADIEIVESHHRYKIDMPSGTAFAMGKAIANGMDKDLKTCVTTYNTNEKRRKPGTINFVSVRAGDIIGEHTAMFVNIGERIEITHKVSDRIIFADGAMKAALWIQSKKNGLFDMLDVFNLHAFFNSHNL